MSRALAFTFPGITLVVLAWHVWSAGAVPAPNIDEQWLADVGYIFYKTGGLYASMFPDSAVHSYGIIGEGNLLFYTLALSFAIGLPGLLEFRLPFVLAGVALILVLFFLARRDGHSPLAAGLACLAASTTAAFYFAAHTGQASILLALVAIIALAAVRKAQVATEQSRFLLWLGLASFLATLTVSFHYGGVKIFAAIALSYLIMSWPSLRRQSSLLLQGAAALAGVVLGAGLFLGLHVVPMGVPTYLDVTSEYLSSESGGASLVSHITWPLQYFKLVKSSTLIELPLIVAGVAAVVLARSPYVRLVSAFAVGMVVFGILLFEQPHSDKFVIIVPFMVWAGVLVIAERIRERGRWLQLAAYAGVVAVVIVGVARGGYYQVIYGDRPDVEFHRRVTAVVPPDVIVSGSPGLWLAFRDRNPYIGGAFAYGYHDPDASGNQLSFCGYLAKHEVEYFLAWPEELARVRELNGLGCLKEHGRVEAVSARLRAPAAGSGVFQPLTVFRHIKGAQEK